MTRVLIPLHGFIAWNGGLDLVRSISSAIESIATSRGLETCYALPSTTQSQLWIHAAIRRWRSHRAGNAWITVANSDAVLRQTAEIISESHQHIRCDASAGGIVHAADEFNADVVFPTMLPLGVNPRKRIGYIFDYQHHHLPHYFSRRIRKHRDQRFRAIAKDADAIMVNSRFVARDVSRHLDVPPECILTLPFAPHALPWWFDACPDKVRSRFGIGRRFLMVCNHFWMHKDHETVLRAFAALRNERLVQDLELVLTGDPIDHRNPTHYRRLVELASALGVSPWVHFLGLIAKRDQLALLRTCIALIQPTLFEGGPGGGAVYEAIGLGVPSVVSDIPVNLEIDQGDVRFFHAGDAEDLAAKVSNVLATPRPRPDRASLLAKGDANLARLGNAICDYLVGLPSR
ncbi:MAG TPA: glycosyltransferase family 1 protein [Rhodanobacteraceae bacterium]|nr:glycosyltransferase family 1 protein [Rhodanobacteraceae bacterium]